MLLNTVAGAAYRSAAACCAAAMEHLPPIERPMVRLGISVWHVPGAGRFYRSVADRYALRLRRSHRPYRRVKVGDSTLVLDVTEFTASSLYFGNVPYEPKTTQYFRQRLGPGSVFADIGANHGYFTVLVAALVGPEGRVFAFEPNPPVFEQLDAHVRLNGFEQRVVLRQEALSETAGDAAGSVPENSPTRPSITSAAISKTSMIFCRFLEGRVPARFRAVSATTQTAAHIAELFAPSLRISDA